MTDEWLSRLRLVRNHVVATNLRSILDLLKWIRRVSSPVVKEELLHSGGFILVLHIVTREETDGAKLVSHDEGLAIAAELAIERVIPHVAIN